jgi:hypothetical protein
LKQNICLKSKTPCKKIFTNFFVSEVFLTNEAVRIRVNIPDVVMQKENFNIKIPERK